MANPFTKNTLRYTDYEMMSDNNWHCTKCEFKSAQAALFRDMKKEGIELEEDTKGNEYKKQSCSNCDRETNHRKLKS